MIKNSYNWVRVTKDNPCVVCKKQDWCTYTDKGLACCMRVQSDRYARNGGWIHNMSNTPLYVAPVALHDTISIIDAPSIWRKWVQDTSNESLEIFANKIGVESMALHLLGCVWAEKYNAWAFPMKNAKSEIIGLRLRNELGQKWAVRGSKQGIFIPKVDLGKRIYIVEGPTDAAAALSINLLAIGRPSCMGCEELICDFIKINKIHEVIILADNDAPGLKGAERLQKQITVKSCIALLPSKDIRDFVNHGGTKVDIENIIKNLVWN